METNKHYLFMINGKMMPVRVLTKRFFTLDEDSEDYKRPVRFVKYEYLKLDHNKRLVYGEGKARASVFKKFAAHITEAEYEKKTLTLKTLYSTNSDTYQTDWFEFEL